GGSRSSSSHRSPTRSTGIARSRAASATPIGPEAAKSSATRWPASAASGSWACSTPSTSSSPVRSAPSATSPRCSSTRVDPSSACRRARAGSSLDTQPHYRPPGQQNDYDNQCAQRHKRATLEARRVEKDLDVVVACAQRHGAKQGISPQHGGFHAVDASAPARVPHLPLQQIAGLTQRYPRGKTLGTHDVA